MYDAVHSKFAAKMGARRNIRQRTHQSVLTVWAVSGIVVQPPMFDSSIAPSCQLHEVFADKRLLITLGSGGVGKTTCAAALGVFYAAAGERVVVITVDPAKRLANALGFGGFENDGEIVRPQLFEVAGLPASGTLFATMLNPKVVFDDLVRSRAGARAEKIIAHPLYDHVAGSLAGIQEYMAIERLHGLLNGEGNKQWDRIILDTPPTANAFDLLHAPQRFNDALRSTPMRILATGASEVGSTLGKGASLALKAAASITGGKFLTDLAELVSSLASVFDGVGERASAFSETLRSQTTAAVIVARPSTASLGQVPQFMDELSRAEIMLAALVINGVYEDEGDIGSLLLSKNVEPDYLEACGKLFEIDRRMAALHNRVLDRHVGILEAVPAIEKLPKLAGDIQDLRALHHLAALMLGH